MHVIACLAEGLGIRGTTRVFEIDANTVLQWLEEATEQLKAFSDYFLHELQINQIQLDELYAVLSAVRDGDMHEAEAVEQLSRSPHWVWTTIDPETKLLLSVQGGTQLGDGSSCPASSCAGIGAGLCAALSERWIGALSHRHRGPLRSLGAATSHTGHRPGP